MPQVSLDQTLQILGGSVVSGRCDLCRQETLDRCRREHPEWFTAKLKHPKIRREKEIETYVTENTIVTTVLQLEDWDECSYYPDERCKVCGTHLHLLALQMEPGREF